MDGLNEAARAAKLELSIPWYERVEENFSMIFLRFYFRLLGHLWTNGSAQRWSLARGDVHGVVLGPMWASGALGHRRGQSK